MAVINTTDVIESSMFLKAKLKKNMVGDNYYMESLQSKIDAEWDYRHNLCDIEEENQKQMKYTTNEPKYTPVEAVVQHVITDTGVKLANDWKKLVFKNIKHPIFRGKRFRFSLDFEKNPLYTEEEKRTESSIWIGVNFDKVSATSGIVVRRCNTNIGFAGSPTLTYDNITEYHYEPCILEDDFKYINVYMNSVVNISQAEIYAIMQYNHFTKHIKINDRVVIGNTDLEDRENNAVFKVKAVAKSTGESTFNVGVLSENTDVSLVVVALSKDLVDSQDDLTNRITSQPPLYQVVQEDTETNPSVPNEPNNSDVSDSSEGATSETEEPYEIMVTQDCEQKLLLNEKGIFRCELKQGSNILTNIEFQCVADLLGTTKDSTYFDLEQVNSNSFSIFNKQPYLNNKLLLTFSCVAPDFQTYTKEVTLTLGGYY